MSYQDKCEKLYRDNKMLKDVLKTVADMRINVGNTEECIRDLETMKSLVKTILAVTE